jgi:hypothetical protein
LIALTRTHQPLIEQVADPLMAYGGPVIDRVIDDIVERVLGSAASSDHIVITG